MFRGMHPLVPTDLRVLAARLPTAYATSILDAAAPLEGALPSAGRDLAAVATLLDAASDVVRAASALSHAGHDEERDAAVADARACVALAAKILG